MSASATETRAGGGAVLRLLRTLTNPAACFLAIGAVGGVLLAIIIPPFGGIDEPAHFARAYQISTGRLMTERPAGADQGGGVCMPDDYADDFERLVTDYLESVYDRTDLDVRDEREEPGAPPPPTPEAAATCGGDEHFYDVSAFAWNSPVSYLPQAFAIAEGRGLGIGVKGQMYMARLAVLATYLGLVFFAIRRSPYAKWGLCAAALVPVALFQAASSRSPDAITTAFAFLVLVSALRSVDAGTDRVRGSRYAERIGLAATLGLLKPTYSVVALCFFLPLLRKPRENPLLVAVPVAVAVAVSALWQRFARDNFVCDTFAFFISPDPDRQIDTILGSPHRYAVAVLASFRDYGGKWLEEFATVGETQANWSRLTIALVLIAVVVVVIKRDPNETFDLRVWQRVLLLAIVFTGMVLLITGEHVYCANVSLTIDYPPHARHYVPLLGLLAAALTLPRRFAEKTNRIPAAAILTVVTAVFVVGVALEMRS